VDDRVEWDPAVVDEVLSEFPMADEIIQRQLQKPAVRARWEETALARAVALRVTAYRAEHKLTQAQLARRLGLKQPQIARLEDGEHTPKIATLMRLAELGIGVTISVMPGDAPAVDSTLRAADETTSCPWPCKTLHWWPSKVPGRGVS
jgi:DNA-binding XRE family transcriptional regulator